jgi:U3 small nucleolar RNA-associated protein 5
MGVIKWLKCILIIHTSFLMSYPDLIDSLGSLFEMMNARTKLFPQLSKLQGKLQLVMSQISLQAASLENDADKDAEPLLYYQDSSSEDEQIEDELIPNHSGFDDYPFSDDEDDDDEDEEDENDDDEDDASEDDEEMVEESKKNKNSKNGNKKSLKKVNINRGRL